MTDTLNERLLAVQSALKAPKSQENKFGGYAYRSCEDILEAVKPLLKEHGLLLTIKDEVVDVAGRVYVKATASICDATADTDVGFEATAYAREAESKKGMDEAQITGSASSYARKYALNGLFLIDDTKDPDATNDHGKAGKADAMEASKRRLWKAIKAYCERNGLDVNAELAEIGGKESLGTKDAKWLDAKSEYYENN